jgi:hypothetical protein
VQAALNRLSGIYIPRQKEIASWEEMLNECRVELKRIELSGEDGRQQQQRISELSKKISRLKAISHHLRSGAAFAELPLGFESNASRGARSYPTAIVQL